MLSEEQQTDATAAIVDLEQRRSGTSEGTAGEYREVMFVNRVEGTAMNGNIGIQ